MSSLSGSHPSGKKRKVVNVVLLNNEEYYVYVDAKSKFQDVFNQVATYLTLRETEYFGLAFKKDGDFQFVSNDEKVHKHAPKGWKTGTGEGFDAQGLPMITLYFRVQFYVDQVVLLREKVTRHLYYLQLKENVLKFQQASLEEKCFLVAAFALQADHGNYASIPSEDRNYFDPREYFPAWMVEKRGIAYLVENTPVVHRDLHNVPRSEAEWRFIKETSLPPAAHNLHFYRLKKRKTDKAWNAWLGICAKGIEIYEDMEDGFKDLMSTFLWPDIGKITFDKKKFEIRPVGSPTGRKFTYYTESDSKSKFLLTLSRNTHMFQMAIQPKLMEIRHLDAEDKRRYRESYIYVDTQDLVTNGGSFRANLSPRTKTAAGGNRYSVVSDASSNTTSGIASDKMTISFEDSDEPGREIMIDCPPLFASHPRSKIVSTLPGYKPSPLPGANRSPVLENKEQFSAYTFPSNRIPSHQTHFTNRTSPSQSPANLGTGQSELLTGGSGSYRARLQQQQKQQQQQQQKQQQSSMYSPVLPAYSGSPPEPSSEKTSRPASRSASRKDSFKEILAQLQVHSAELKAAKVMPQPHLVETPRLKHVPSFHMEDMDDRPVSRSSSSDHRTHRSTASDASNQSLLASSSTVTSVGSPHPHHLSHGSATSFGSSEMKLEEAEEMSMPPPPMFADEGALMDIPVETVHLQSQTVMEQALTELSEAEPVTDTTDAQVSPDDGSEEESEDRDATGQAAGKKAGKPTHITVQNQKEVLHPEIEEIRGQTHAFSLPFITALCNDKSLLPNNSRPGSVSSAGDVSIHDTRRLSVNYPSSASGTMVTVPSNRPFSWHSESFDLDAQLASLNGNASALVDNHRSVPQNLSEFTTSATSSWTHAIAYSMPFKQTMDRYSPELIATQLMIPPRLSSGGHNKNDGTSIQHKALMKENFGIA